MGDILGGHAFGIPEIDHPGAVEQPRLCPYKRYVWHRKVSISTKWPPRGPRTAKCSFLGLFGEMAPMSGLGGVLGQAQPAVRVAISHKFHRLLFAARRTFLD